MIWFKLGWRNLWRNRRRTIIELVSIGGTVFLVVAWNNLALGSYSKMINDGVKMGSGHIGIYHHDYLELRKTELVIPAGGLIAAIEQDPGVEGVYPRLHVPGLIRSSRDSRVTLLMGIDFERETGINPLLADKRIVEGALPAKNKKTALIGATLARELGLSVGKKFVIMVQGSDGEIASSLLKVAGILQSNIREIDSGAVIIDRTRLGEIIGYEDSAHEIAILLKSHKDVEKALPRFKSLASQYPHAEAFHWEKAMPALAAGVNYDHAALMVTVVILYIMVGIGTINTLLMSVMERTREFGMIRAIGTSKSNIRKMVLSEAFVLSCAGVVLGLILSVLVGLYTSTHGIDFSSLMEEQGMGGTLIDPLIKSIWSLSGMVILSVGMIVIALVASIYPTRRVLKIQPSEAMRIY